MLTAIKAGLIQSAHDIAEGGFAVALAEKAFGAKGLGLEVTVQGSAVTTLFSESQSRFIVTIKPENASQFEAIVEDAVKIGQVTDTNNLVISQEDGTTWISGSVEEFRSAWKGAIPCLLNSEA